MLLFIDIRGEAGFATGVLISISMIAYGNRLSLSGEMPKAEG